MYGVSFPVEPTSKKVKINFEEKIASGEIDIGENIVEREYKKIVYDKKTGQLVSKTCSVFGRKHYLLNIRIKVFNRCKKFMRLNPDILILKIYRGMS